MNTEVKQQWLEALRSGQYKQGQGYLHTKKDGVETFCCLGVLSDLAVKAGAAKITGERITGSSYDVGGARFHGDHGESHLSYGTDDEDDGYDQLPPENVWKWAGLQCEDPAVAAHVGGYDTTLADLNDRGHSFEEIANIIEEEL